MMMRSLNRVGSFAAILASLALAACGNEAALEAATESEALSRTAAGVRVDLTAGIAGGALVVHGRANGEVTRAFAFVPDDEIGTTETKGTTFTTTLPLAQATGLFAGQPLFVSVAMADGRYVTARAEVRLGAPKDALFRYASAFTSYRIDGRTMLRVEGSYAQPLLAFSGTFLGPDPKPRWQGAVSGTRFAVDLPLELVAAAAVTEQPVAVLATIARDEFSGSFVPRASITALALTTADAYDTWPAPQCTPQRARCLAQATDTSTCGTAYELRACAPSPMTSRTDDALAAYLANESAGLLYLSESDAPFETVLVPGAADAVASLEAFRTALGIDAQAHAEEGTLDNVFGFRATDDASAPNGERFSAARFRALAEALRTSLTDVHVYRVGTVRIDVYIVGRTPAGSLAGLKTLSIET